MGAMVTQIRWGLLLALLGSAAFCQTTTINLGTQGRNFDFSNAAFTRPATVGTSLPATCTVGQIFFNISAAAGQNLYGCSATNIWTVVGNSTTGSASGVQTVAGVAPVNGDVELASSNLTDAGNINRHSTVVNLPSASSASGVMYWVTNGSSPSDCSVGGGTYAVPCISNGSYWIPDTIGTGSSTAVQTTMTGTQSLSGPLLAPQLNNVFYVAGYKASGTHTDYDMARQAADAYAVANPSVGSILVLKPTINQTCDAVPLPSLGTQTGYWGTTSIIGHGSNVSSITKRSGCPAVAATLSHGDSPTGMLSRGWYQGFTVDASHVDSAGCNIYGMSLTTFMDVACGDAAPGADHEWEFGDLSANNVGWADNIYGYQLRTFDYVGVGKGGQLTPVWSGSALASVTVANPGTKKYTVEYTRASLIGPDLSTCTSVPTVSVQVSTVQSSSFPNLSVHYGNITGVTITNPGNCASTGRLYFLVQDGPPVTYGMKFTNMADSALYDLENTSIIGEYISNITSNNSFIAEHPYTNQTIQIADYGNGNKHVNTEFDSPGQYAAVLGNQGGSFVNPTISWDGVYPGTSGYYFDNANGPTHAWFITNSVCTLGAYVGAQPWFQLFTDRSTGPMSASNPITSGIYFTNAQVCDGSNTVINSLGAQSASADGANFGVSDGRGYWFGASPALAAASTLGIHQDLNGNNMLWLRNTIGGSTADQDAFGIDSQGQVSLSEPINGDLVVKEMTAPGAPTLSHVGATGTTSYSYACTAVSAAGLETSIGTTATIGTANATLDSSDYNTVLCPFVEGAKFFNVYRQTNGGNLGTGYIGQATKANYQRGMGLRDSGQAASTAQPTSNATGNIVIKTTSGNTVTLTASPTGNRTITLPDTSGTLALAGSSGSSGSGTSGSSSTGITPAAAVSLTGQTASLAKTTLYTPTTAGTFQVAITAYMTTAATSAGTIQVGASYNNGTVMLAGGNLANAYVTGNPSQLTYIIHAVAGQPIQYYVNLTGTNGSPVYGVDAVVMRLQ